MTGASASSRRTLLLCLHNHQPVGNFDHVLEEATRNAYRPFLETLSAFPRIKATLHFSGFLLRWLVANHPGLHGLLRDLAARGQVEVLGGGMYEPILALLPERDREGQIRALEGAVRDAVGRSPEGIWLAERVWEPELPASLAAAGVRYLPLDDYHFVRAGISPEELDGVYITEARGASVLVFPGSERLRYLIPFGDVGETLREIDRMTSRDVPFPAAIFADDGEKFGVWPGTHKSVYGEGWLRRFFEGIEARSEWLSTMTLGEYVARSPVRGRVYLPSCSYVEMGEWTLPAGPAARFGDILQALRAGRNADLKPFLQGGHFRSFLRKYEEANQLHKRMWWVSERVAEAGAKGDAREARDFLYRSQCNDAYWHGVFGGLYLNHLREAAYANLLRAESAADRILHRGKGSWTECVKGDLDTDGGEEILVKTSRLTLLSHLHDGGALTEISLPARGIALGHVLTRRTEGYHEKLKAAGGGFDGQTSIHDVLLLKDPSVLDALATDPWQRASFREAFYRDPGGIPAIRDGTASPAGVSAGKAAAVEVHRSGARAALSLELSLLSDAGEALVLEKTLDVKAGDEAFRSSYRVANTGRNEVAGLFASEWNLNFLSGSGPDRHIELSGRIGALSEKEATGGLREFRVVDGWRGIVVHAAADREFALLRYPVETASLSEAGVEKIHQGVCLVLFFPLRLSPGDFSSISLSWAFHSAGG